MTPDLLPPPSALALLQDDLQTAAELANEANAAASLRAYRSAWKRFEAYCVERKLEAWESPASVASYLAYLVGQKKKWSTLEQAKSAISYAHRVRGLSSPTRHPQVQLVATGARRRLGQVHKGKEPVRIDDLLKWHDAHRYDARLRTVRDRAILLVGFTSALRRSNLAALQIQDLTFEPRGLTLFVAKSKTDQTGKGRFVAILRRPRLCPVRATEEWLVQLGSPQEGPLFRAIDRHGHISADPIQPDAICAVVKRAMRSLGYDSRFYGAHSLRSGFATAAAEANKPLPDILRQGGWTDVKTALNYVRRAQLFEANASDVLP